jgi:hypothetical protein
MTRQKKYPPAAELKRYYDTLQEGFQLVPLLEQMLKFVVETGNAKTPLMTKIVCSLKDLGTEEPVILIWASANLADSPLLRIEQLKEENRRLQRQLADHINRDHDDLQRGEIRVKKTKDGQPQAAAKRSKTD